MRKNNAKKWQLERLRIRAQREAIEYEMTIPEPPLIYSIKFNVGERYNYLNFFRDKCWKSILRCNYRAQMKSHTPVVLFVRFYVPPPEYVEVSKEILKAEKTPAVRSFELCEYLLSFQEMLFEVLFHSYRQVVRIEVDKFYSDKPRTVMKFMTWSHYVELHDKNPINAKGKSKRTTRKKGDVQSVSKGDGGDPAAGDEAIDKKAAVGRSADSGVSLPNPRPSLAVKHKTQSAKGLGTRYKTGWRQSGEVSE